jgi:hypothetical protein
MMLRVANWYNPVVIFCYTNDAAVVQHRDDLLRFLGRMGNETNQGAVGFVIDGNYCELSFPLTNGGADES